MITSTSSTDRTVRPEILPAGGKPATRTQDARLDQISIENAVFLRAELARQPEIRAEVVARARMLAADPTYPPLEAVQNVAEQILRSRDLSEDES
jgi:hypothetical protein